MQHESLRVLLVPILVPILVLGTALPAAAQSAGTQTPPALLNANGASDTAPDDEVAIDVDAANRTIAVFTAVDPVDGDLDVHMTYSLDQGASWTPSAPASPVMAIAFGDEIEPTVSANAGGWRYAYAKSATGSSEHDIWWGAVSGGPSSFSNNGELQSDAVGDVFDDRLPCLASAGPTAGTATSICVWQRESAAGDEDVCFSRYDAGIPAWSPTAFLHTSFAGDAGRDRFPRVAGDGAGNWVCVWYSTNDLGGTIGTDHDVLVSRSIDDGVTWNAPVALNSTAATDGTSSDLSPAITVDPASGTWLVVWQSTNSLGGTIGIDNDVFVARSTDAGATWSAVVPLNTDAATDHLGVEDNDNFVDVAVDGSGRFVTVWQRGDSPPTEYDIRRATSTDLGVTWTAPELVNTARRTPARTRSRASRRARRGTGSSCGTRATTWAGRSGRTWMCSPRASSRPSRDFRAPSSASASTTPACAVRAATTPR